MRVQPVRLQKGCFPPLAHSVGSLVLRRYAGKDVPCVRTFLDLIDLESPAKYYGIVEHQMKTMRFELKKKIIAVDGEIAVFEIKLGRMNGLKSQMTKIAPREATLSGNPDAYIVNERGESFKAHIVKWRNNDDLAVCLERGKREDLPKGCPIYDNKNQVIGLIKRKIYGSLWAVKWCNGSHCKYQVFFL